MSHLVGSVPYLQDLANDRLREHYERAKDIRDLTALNFQTWPDMTPEEKDVTNRQAQRAISELAGMVMHMIRHDLEDLRRNDE